MLNATKAKRLLLYASRCNISVKRIFLFLLLFASVATGGQRETRGVWISTNYRLDFPGALNDTEKQKSELIRIFKDIRKRNFNTVYFQVRSGGALFYPSSKEPLSPYIPRTAGKADYDPLKFAIETAHSMQLEFIAWINVFNITQKDPAVINDSNFVTNKHPNWVTAFSENGTNKQWLDPGLPEVRAYLTDLILELTQNYAVDGIVLDYLRYPSRKFNDDFSFTLYGNEKSLSRWRRDNINGFLDTLYRKCKTINPYLKIGVSPLGIYKNNADGNFFSAYEDVYQDALNFLKSGIADFITPQVYWAIDFNPAFDKVSKFWIENSFGRNIVINLGAYKPEIIRELFTQIKTVRKIGASGFGIYRYSNIKNNGNIKFNSFVFPAKMYFIDDYIPKEPRNFVTNITSANPLNIVFAWELADKNTDKFALYKFTDSNPVLLTLLPGKKNAIRIQIDNPENHYSFALKSLSKLKNESIEYSNIVKLNLKELESIFASFENSGTGIRFTHGYLSLSSKENQILKILSENGNLLYSIPVLKGVNVIPITITGKLRAKFGENNFVFGTNKKERVK